MMIENSKKISLWNKLHIDFILILFVMLILIYSIFITWSASGQNIKMIENKIIQIIIGILIMMLLAQIPPKVYETWAPYLYIFCIVLLIQVDVFGQNINGAKRWLNFSIFHFQPSEIAKISIPLMIAYCINKNGYPPSLTNVIINFALIFIPTFLVARQPDLGTAILIATSGLFVLFLSGITWKLIVLAICLIVAFIPVLWFFLMHDYQKNRVLMLLYPESDPLGAGYHIIQSKIAIGSGGSNGKGWLNGTQSQLEFLPERHTDFIFSVLSEELGLVGALILLFFYLGIITRGLLISSQAQNSFGQVISGSFILILFFYMFVNIGMVSGILPVVGIPLPLMSYGGSALIVVMAGFGIIMSIHTHRKMLSKNL